jgi:uncharacterized protein
MKNLLLFFILVFSSQLLHAQEIVGSWGGGLKTDGGQLRINIHIKGSAENGYTATFDSPTQKVYGVPFSEVRYDGATLVCLAPEMGLTYEAGMRAEELTGIWRQGGMSLSLNLVKYEEPKAPIRPQEPIGEVPYTNKDVEFVNELAGITLSGTLSLPTGKGPFPAVILVSGSGPQDRNSEVFGHKPFLVLADYLVRNGIAVLRYDDRGIASSKGDFSTATSADFADDAEAAFTYLQKQAGINAKKIGIIGHSEGGMIAPMVAARNKKVAFVVMIAGPAMAIDELMIAQGNAIATASGIDETLIAEALTFNSKFYNFLIEQPDLETAKAKLDDFLSKNRYKQSDGELVSVDELKKQLTSALTPWFHYFIKYNPSENLSKMQCPVLAIYGSKDLQVPAKQNIEALTPIFEKSKSDHLIVELSDLNHLMQNAETGNVSEYDFIEETMAPKALETISNWILALRK